MEIIDVIKLLNKEAEPPKSFKDLKKRWTDVYYGISIHTTGAAPRFKSLQGKGMITPPNYFGPEYQRLFDDFYFSRHPRENEETRQWRYSQYKPIQRAPFLQIIEVISGAIFQDSNYVINIPNEKDSEYILTGNNFDGHDMIGWFANIGIPCLMEDPNGLFVRMPSKPYYQQTSGNIEVSLLFVNSKDIVYYDKNELLFLKDNYCYYIDSNTIWRFSYDEKSKKYYLHPDDANGYYATMFGKLPVDVAGGWWNTQGFNESFLVKAKAVADDFVACYSAEQMIDKEASHPFIIMADEDCPTCTGLGVIQIPVEDSPGQYDLKQCSTCHGKKTVSVSPGDRISAPKEDMISGGDLVKIISPDTTINDYHHKKTGDIYLRLLDGLNLLRTEQAQSGAAKAIDQERLYQFISKISNHFFDKIAHNTISDIVAYRNTLSINGRTHPANYYFSITKPTQFNIKQTSDLLIEFDAATKANMPLFVRKKMAIDFIDKQYSGDYLLKKQAELIIKLDDLAVVPEADKLTKLMNGEVSKEDLIFSLKLPAILEEIVRTNSQGWFLNASFNDIKAKVDALFVQFKPQPEHSPDHARKKSKHYFQII